ncbi:Gfo/Idh/MocA family oxidoreductase [Flavobacteriales bacterium]|nr:Gfo/Idh/MocA family oxidoreductase [Flavobacteriales bacterium]
MLKIGVIGAGHLGKIHLKLLLELKDTFEVIGFYDTDRENARIVNRSFRVKSFKSIEHLIEEADIIDIVSPTISHYDCASLAIRSNKHVFIEKPITQTVLEAEALMKLSREAGVKVQVGHVERFNSAFKSALAYINQPLFIESHRLAEFNPRGTDVPVVLDLMIHDLDIVLKLVNSPVKSVQASGVSVVSDTPDIANARIEFNNGCVCNLTASRMSLKNMRKSRVFQKDAYISIDYLVKKTEVIRLKNIKPSEEIDPLAVVLDLGKGKRKKQIYFENPSIEENNAIKDEFISFANAITEDIEPEVSITDGLRALELAVVILEKMKLNHQLNVM